MSSILIAICIVGGVGLIAGIGLAVASVAFAVPVDEKIEKITEILPGANCGGCGYTGCAGYAEGIVKDGAKTNLCNPGGESVAKAIAEVLGVDAEAAEKMRAVVLCNGTRENAHIKMNYQGIRSCRAASQLGSDRQCVYGCLGFGDCVEVCAYGGISIQDGVAVVNDAECKQCGLCVTACPKGLIRMIPAGQQAVVLCSSRDKGAEAKEKCQVSCIGCSLCVKKCPENCIEIKDNCAVIDYAKCNHCGTCVSVCPRHSIHLIG